MKGTYTLVLNCKDSFLVNVGKIGHAKVVRGILLYTGSALGKGGASLEKRIERHQSRNKRLKWHVDFLTVQPEIEIVSVIYLASVERLECQINQSIEFELDGKPIILHAGATDCNCNGHLLSIGFSDSQLVLTRLQHIYSQYGKPFIDENSRTNLSAILPSNAKSVLKYSN